MKFFSKNFCASGCRPHWKNQQGTTKDNFGCWYQRHKIDQRSFWHEPQFINKFGKALGLSGCLLVEFCSSTKPMVKLRLKPGFRTILEMFCQFMGWLNLIIFLSLSLPWIILYPVPLVYSRFSSTTRFPSRSTCRRLTSKVEKIGDWFDELTIIQFGTGWLWRNRARPEEIRGPQTSSFELWVGDLVLAIYGEP